ncbi:hypothetical protein [Saccharopolyspora gloriosae]|uniref:hypothetical protein n=1 Tax=Saccharopolyspora gloriosae TaxID=455344 RepID=UPI001FB631E2|nr:hypothetical protein [Saccharopolyspora gloriosae]
MAKFERLRYDVTDIAIADAVCDIVNVADLEQLAPNDRVATRETDQATTYHKLFYDKFDQVWPLYRKLATTVLGARRQDFYIQKVPTFRVHLRNSVAVGTWHRDSDFGHDSSETNYWVPLTRAFGNNTLWIDNAPVDSEYGDIVVFDGANTWHGNKVNDTEISRVSMDFRTIPRSAYRDTGKRSVSAGVPFVLGEYWDIL